MRHRLILADPVTALAVGGGLFSGVGALASAGATAAQQEAQAGFARAQAQREEVQQAREQRDLRREKRRTLAASRVALGDQPAGNVNRGAILSQQAQEFGVASSRMRQDSRARQSGLRARGTNLDAAAGSTRVGGALTAGANVFGGASRTLLSRSGG